MNQTQVSSLFYRFLHLRKLSDLKAPKGRCPFGIPAKDVASLDPVQPIAAESGNRQKQAGFAHRKRTVSGINCSILFFRG
jgi:hypothetical protein